MHIVIVQVTVRPDRLDEFREALLHNAAESLAHDAGCVRFDIGQDRDDPCRWVLYEVYEAPADHERHRRSPHFLAYDVVAGRAVIEKRVTVYRGQYMGR
jgi:(4S)-4-hydroxy-5-phosphonooxypentane-2,3-dione isomerase